ncbi:Mg2+ and Co2+ transporter CorA [Sphaerotilus hippei]|uniref:Mg2+ and Co2+ transporter CorA n=1 Tax=Sphaerotilus hippei TaxID=744406 RepID=A0A318HAW9_9BURK|nr:magnesium transporter CorA family protein [Sphaerotilus hippei]PXW95871.1 Mg2+ and Co2+ transporter CorA [Sphaerotilus hippei]
MRVFLISDSFTELPGLPAQLPETGHLWITSGRREFEVNQADLQNQLQAWTGSMLIDLHVSDLLNHQLPSHFDYTSVYDLLVFRRLAAGAGSSALFLDEDRGTARSALEALRTIDTSPVGFAVFDRCLLTVHPADCQIRDFFVERLRQMQVASASGVSRLPPNPADLMLRIVNHMVDSYLDLRRLLTRQLGTLQQELFGKRPQPINWRALLESRNTLHQLEDICEDQRSAIQEWMDALAEWPAAADPAAKTEQELLRVRSRDVLEHIERVLTHVRRLESSVESAVQMHFSDMGQRTNEIMRTLTVLTAIFLPLNLITGIFGMNFESMPLLKDSHGFWISIVLMASVVVGLVSVFWRRRYIGHDR